MKGVSFQAGTEFKLNVIGETWHQGDLLTGTLIASAPHAIQVQLAYGIDKKIKSKAIDAFVILNERHATGAELKWEFSMPNLTRITDKSGGLYLLYGYENPDSTQAFLKLNVLPHPLILELCDVMKHHFRFITKTISSNKNGSVEIKFDKPDMKEWASLEHLIIHFSVASDHACIQCIFEFHRMEVDGTKVGLGSKKTKRIYDKTWPTEKLIHDFNQRLDKEAAQNHIQTVMDEYRDTRTLI